MKLSSVTIESLSTRVFRANDESLRRLRRSRPPRVGEGVSPSRDVAPVTFGTPENYFDRTRKLCHSLRARADEE